MHHVPVHEALLALESDRERGLSEQDAARRLVGHGPNVLPRVERRGALLRLLLQFHHPLIYTLLAAAAATFAIGEPVDASVILGVVIANAAIGFIQEARAEGALDALTKMVTTRASVVRDGRRRELPAAELVPGDLVELTAGDKVSSDVRLVHVRDLQVDESSLTGESVPVVKADAVLAPETLLADRANMAFSGTLVTYGSARGVVVATGGDTELGLIHRLLSDPAELATPLTRTLAHFSRLLTVVILAVAVFTFGIGLARGETAADMLVAAVALAVGAIPEGLPAAVTIALAIGVTRMARRNAIVRRLPAVETLGSASVICTDKTGTLTQNAMTVQVVLAGGVRYELGGAGYAPEGSPSLDGAAVTLDSHPALAQCLLGAALCGDSDAVHRDGSWQPVGDPTEAALVVAARKAGVERSDELERRPRVDVLPFESERQFMLTVHDAPDGRTLYTKGAVERIASMCDRQLEADGTTGAFDPAAAASAAAALGAEGMRVLAVAAGPLRDGLDLAQPAGLTFLGLQAMMDPPRPEAAAAIRSCRRAGIAVKMITGDHAATAHAIATRLGLADEGGSAEVVTGRQLAAAADGELAQMARQASVFARVSAEDKLRLVRALQHDGAIIAMTGDGVNDAPALRQADIGVAMGLNGTEVAREASDIVLADDNFASIEAAAEEGRHTFDNLTKFVVWTLPTNVGEGLLILTAIVAGTTLPVLPVQVLWINMTTAVLLGLTLAFEAPEPGIMRRPPRRPGAPIVGRSLLRRMVLVGLVLVVAAFLLFELERARGVPLDEARTIAVNVFVVVELLYLFSCRSLTGSARELGFFTNRWLLGGVALMIVLQLAFTYWPPMQALFHSAAPDPSSWLKVAAAGVVGWAVAELDKRFERGRAGAGGTLHRTIPSE